MSDDDAKTAKLREIVGRVFPPEQADTFVEYARLPAFLNDAGEIDEEKVYGHMTAIYAAQQQHPTTPGPGEQARAALRARHGVGAENGNGNGTPSAGSRIPPGSAGREALARRHGRTPQR